MFILPVEHHRTHRTAHDSVETSGGRVSQARWQRDTVAAARRTVGAMPLAGGRSLSTRGAQAPVSASGSARPERQRRPVATAAAARARWQGGWRSRGPVPRARAPREASERSERRDARDGDTPPARSATAERSEHAERTRARSGRATASPHPHAAAERTSWERRRALRRVATWRRSGGSEAERSEGGMARGGALVVCPRAAGMFAKRTTFDTRCRRLSLVESGLPSPLVASRCSHTHTLPLISSRA